MFPLPCAQGRLAFEGGGLFQLDGEAQSSLVGRHQRRQFVTPRAVALLQMQRVDGEVAGVHKTEVRLLAERKKKKKEEEKKGQRR